MPTTRAATPPRSQNAPPGTDTSNTSPVKNAQNNAGSSIRKETMADHDIRLAREARRLLENAKILTPEAFNANVFKGDRAKHSKNDIDALVPLFKGLDKSYDNEAAMYPGIAEAINECLKDSTSNPPAYCFDTSNARSPVALGTSLDARLAPDLCISSYYPVNEESNFDVANIFNWGMISIEVKRDATHDCALEEGDSIGGSIDPNIIKHKFNDKRAKLLLQSMRYAVLGQFCGLPYRFVLHITIAGNMLRLWKISPTGMQLTTSIEYTTNPRHFIEFLLSLKLCPVAAMGLEVGEHRMFRDVDATLDGLSSTELSSIETNMSHAAALYAKEAVNEKWLQNVHQQPGFWVFNPATNSDRRTSFKAQDSFTKPIIVFRNPIFRSCSLIARGTRCYLGVELDFLKKKYTDGSITDKDRLGHMHILKTSWQRTERCPEIAFHQEFEKRCPPNAATQVAKVLAGDEARSSKQTNGFTVPFMIPNLISSRDMDSNVLMAAKKQQEKFKAEKDEPDIAEKGIGLIIEGYVAKPLKAATEAAATTGDAESESNDEPAENDDNAEEEEPEDEDYEQTQDQEHEVAPSPEYVSEEEIKTAGIDDDGESEEASQVQEQLQEELPQEQQSQIPTQGQNSNESSAEVENYLDRLIYGQRPVIERALQWVLFDQVGGSLDSVRNVKELVDVLSDVTRAHQDLYEADILHRDISPNNIMIDLRTRRGLLIDLDMAKDLRDDKERGIREITGTMLCMSIRLKDGPIHDVWHEMESIAWVFLWAVIRLVPGVSYTYDKIKYIEPSEILAKIFNEDGAFTPLQDIAKSKKEYLGKEDALHITGFLPLSEPLDTIRSELASIYSIVDTAVEQQRAVTALSNKLLKQNAHTETGVQQFYDANNVDTLTACFKGMRAQLQSLRSKAFKTTQRKAKWKKLDRNISMQELGLPGVVFPSHKFMIDVFQEVQRLKKAALCATRPYVPPESVHTPQGAQEIKTGVMNSSVSRSGSNEGGAVLRSQRSIKSQNVSLSEQRNSLQGIVAKQSVNRFGLFSPTPPSQDRPNTAQNAFLFGAELRPNAATSSNVLWPHRPKRMSTRGQPVNQAAMPAPAPPEPRYRTISNQSIDSLRNSASYASRASSKRNFADSGLEDENIPPAKERRVEKNESMAAPGGKATGSMRPPARKSPRRSRRKPRAAPN